jgi:hypothetical protein
MPPSMRTFGRTSSTLRPRVTRSPSRAATVSSTAATTRCQLSAAQLRKCALTQNLLCSTVAPGTSASLGAGVGGRVGVG